VKVIEVSENEKLTVKQIVAKFNIGKTQVYDILKAKSEIRNQWLNCNGSIKRKPMNENEDITKIVWEWFVSVRSRNFGISGTMIQEHAKEVAEKLGKSEFKASNEWLESFRKRHQIVFNEVCGESGDVCGETVADWVAKLPSVMDGYEPKDIANGDETGLFLHALPSKTLCLKGERCSGGKLCKERLTVFFCGFMTGEIEKPLVIGRAAKPRCFKNIDIKKLPVDWKSNKKAWMTSHIMEEWLTAFNAKMKQQNHNVLLFLDNATCHPHIELSNVRLVWFTPNNTSVSQPVDQGVIKCVKLICRKLIMKSLLANMDAASSATELAKFISVLDAVIWMAEATKQVSPQTVQRHFQKAKFSMSNLNEKETNENNIQDLQESLNRATYENAAAEDYLNIDAKIETEAATEETDDTENHQQGKE
jgi:hypothetical protein